MCTPNSYVRLGTYHLLFSLLIAEVATAHLCWLETVQIPQGISNISGVLTFATVALPLSLPMPVSAFTVRVLWSFWLNDFFFIKCFKLPELFPIGNLH